MKHAAVRFGHGQHGVVDRRTKERPIAIHASNFLVFRRGCKDRFQRRPQAVPGRHQAAALGPREYPRDRAQVLEPIGGTYAAPDANQSSVLRYRQRASPRGRTAKRRVLDQSAIGAKRRFGESTHQLRPRVGHRLRLLVKLPPSPTTALAPSGDRRSADRHSARPGFRLVR